MEHLLHIGSMMCDGCAGRVKKALEAVPGVRSARVSYTDGTALVVCDGDVPLAALANAVEQTGYENLDH